MDIGTLLGLIFGFGAVFGGQLLEGGKISALIQPTSFLIVVGGTMGAVFVSFPLSTIITAMKDVMGAFIHKEEDPAELIQMMATYADKARRTGLLALEEEIAKTKDRLIRKGISLMVDGAEVGLFREFMEIEIATFEEESKASAEVFEAAGGFSPTIGIIGAVLGLIQVMSNLSDTEKLGEGIAVAFVATIYGLMLANIIAIPLGTRLKKRMKEKLMLKEIVFEGFQAIMQGENPRLIVEKLQG